MGTLVGHVAPGFGFLLIGLWHLFNHIKLHLNQPNTYTAPSWFPTSKFKYLELFLIMGGSSASIAMELFIGPQKHQPLDDDGTIPTKPSPQLRALFNLHDFLGLCSFCHQFFGQLCEVTKHIFPRCWLMVMGFMLWTPDLMPKGCSMNLEEGHKVVRCHGDEALHRAKSLVNLQFSWFLLGVAIFGVSFYLGLVKVYGEKVEGSDHDVEYQKTSKREDSKSFVNHMGKTAFASIDIER
ncbi:hypothetical protein D8674_007220 [Pyrus ussuriensis x Pyrus communis]|uniref:Uncharacterized protein n=1 Tax=Pyrus ussuriensis x Pyrus communis TaxID=2448454 RepID=A0A5N5FWQ6_9ROSA|nr:hypothetical protein D8674_007220 [Pyrus ussuriensis x Pyrus communis]